MRMRYRPSTRPLQCGFTLIELVMFIVIVAVGLAGILSVMNMTARNTVDPLLQKQAQSLAEGMLEEVQLGLFAYCDGADPQVYYASNATQCTIADSFGGDAGENRPFNTVRDYVSAYNTATNITTDINGAAWPSGFTVSVLVDNTVVVSPIPAGEALLIRVVATGPANVTATAEGYRMRQQPIAP